MAESRNNLKAVLQDTANAIRSKTGSASNIIPRFFADTISLLPNQELVNQFYSGTLVNVVIPDDVSTLRTYCFADTLLESVDFNGITTIPAYCCYNCRNLTSVQFSLNTTRIEDYAFQDCTKIDNLSLPHTLTNIGVSAFQNVGSSYPRGTHTFTMIDNVGVHTTIGQSAFESSHLSKIDAYTNNIGSSAFKNCQSLTDVNIEIHGSVDNNAFYGCAYVENFEINANSVITSFGGSVFTNLAYYTVASSRNISAFDFRNSTFTSIGGNVWSSCKFDGIVYFPTTLATISGNFLTSATGNWTLYFNSVPTVSSAQYLRFNQSGFTVKYCFPYELLDTASSATNWSSHTSQIRGFGTGFTAGSTLPARTSGGNILTWYSDVNLTTQITTSSSADDTYYCKIN